MTWRPAQWPLVPGVQLLRARWKESTPQAPAGCFKSPFTALSPAGPSPLPEAASAPRHLPRPMRHLRIPTNCNALPGHFCCRGCKPTAFSPIARRRGWGAAELRQEAHSLQADTVPRSLPHALCFCRAVEYYADVTKSEVPCGVLGRDSVGSEGLPSSNRHLAVTPLGAPPPPRHALTAEAGPVEGGDRKM